MLRYECISGLMVSEISMIEITNKDFTFTVSVYFICTIIKISYSVNIPRSGEYKVSILKLFVTLPATPICFPGMFRCPGGTAQVLRPKCLLQTLA